MKRFVRLLVLSTSFAIAGVAHGQASGPAGARPSPGDYSGKLQEEGGSGSSDVKLNIKHITADGRVTARVQGTHPLQPCTTSLPASGLVLKDGTVRLEVDAGAPEGCERIYNLKSVSAGALSGTYIDAIRSGGKLIPRKKGS